MNSDALASRQSLASSPPLSSPPLSSPPLSSPPLSSPPLSLPPHLRRRNIILGSVLGGVVVIIVAIVLIYLFVFRPRVYYGQRVAFTTVQGQPPARYGLTSSTAPNATAGLLPSNMTPLIIKSATNKTGQVKEGDQVLIWQPLTNAYLFANECSQYVHDQKACQAAQGPFTDNTCVWNNKSCQASAKNMAELVWRPLSQPVQKAYIFEFMKTPKSSANVRVKDTYALQSVLNSQFVVPNANARTLVLTDKETKTWQLLK